MGVTGYVNLVHIYRRDGKTGHVKQTENCLLMSNRSTWPSANRQILPFFHLHSSTHTPHRPTVITVIHVVSNSSVRFKLRCLTDPIIKTRPRPNVSLVLCSVCILFDFGLIVLTNQFHFFCGRLYRLYIYINMCVFNIEAKN